MRKRMSVGIPKNSRNGEYAATHKWIKTSRTPYKQFVRGASFWLQCSSCGYIFHYEGSNGRYPREWYKCPGCRRKIKTSEILGSDSNEMTGLSLAGIFKRIKMVLISFFVSILLGLLAAPILVAFFFEEFDLDYSSFVQTSLGANCIKIVYFCIWFVIFLRILIWFFN